MTPEEAQQVINDHKKERAEKATEALKAVCKEYNVKLDQIGTVAQMDVLLSELLGIPIKIVVTAL